MPYQQFSQYYDLFTKNVNYPGRAAYFDRIIKRFAPESRLLLDLACGTGSLSVELAKYGYQVIGTDGSVDMLSVAAEKARTDSLDILFISQKMQDLALIVPVDAAVCALDSLNHITEKGVLCRVLGRVFRFLKPGGIFVFDVNTLYKHRKVLSNNAFLFEESGVFCAWQNEYSEENHVVTIYLDFFEKIRDNQYKRSCECFQERAYSHRELTGIVRESGMELIACYDEDSFLPAHSKTQRAVYVCRKPKHSRQRRF